MPGGVLLVNVVLYLGHDVLGTLDGHRHPLQVSYLHLLLKLFWDVTVVVMASSLQALVHRWLLSRVGVVSAQPGSC